MPADADLQVVPVRHPGRAVAVVALAVLAAMAGHALATNPRFGWSVVRSNLFAAPIRAGVSVTVQLTVISMVIGILGGMLLAVMRLSPNVVLRGVSAAYTFFFRGTPLLVQILFWNFIAALYPRLAIGVPFGPHLASIDPNRAIAPFRAAILALGLNEAAYMAEIMRAGILSVDPGQSEAALALGMRRVTVLRRVVLPQALRVILPPTGNETISMLKTTSLVFAISLADLLYSAQLIYSRNFEQIPLLIVVSIWYLALTSVLSAGQAWLERRVGRGFRGTPTPPRWRRTRPGRTAAATGRAPGADMVTEVRLAAGAGPRTALGGTAGGVPRVGDSRRWLGGLR